MSSELKELYEYIHEITPDLVKNYFTEAKKRGTYICIDPECNNGTGPDGDGLVVYPHGVIDCFKCGNVGDLVTYIARIHGLEPKSKEALKLTCEMFPNELLDRYNAIFNKNQSKLYTAKPMPKIQPVIHTHAQKPKTPAETNTQETNRILEAINGTDNRLQDLIEQARANLTHPKAIEFFKSRHISLETARAGGAGFLPAKTQIGFTKDNKDNIKPRYIWTDSIIYPDTLAGFITRAIDPEAKPKSLKPSIDKDGKSYFDTPYLISEIVRDKDKKLSDKGQDLEPVFIVEGPTDALSYKEIGLDAISLNGTANRNKIINIFKEYEIKRPLILNLDNDKEGRKAQERAYQEFKEAGLEVYNAEIIPKDLTIDGLKITDANEYLIADRIKFIESAQKARITPPIKDFESTFNKAKIGSFLNGIQERANTPAIPTGFKTLDSEYFLDGGLYEGLYIIGAISSLGKTTIMQQIADQIAKSGQDVLYISLEMSTEELIARSISRYTAKDVVNTTKPERVYPKTLRDITDKKRYDTKHTKEEIDHIHKAIFEYSRDTGDTMRIVQSFGDLTVKEIRQLVEEHTRHRGKPPVVFIDYLQILAPPADQPRSMTDKQAVDHNVKSLKQLSVDYKIPVFAISSFNRDNYNNEVSMLSFKESGAIEYSSDVLIGLERKNHPRREGTGEQARINYEKAVKELEEEERRTGIREIRLKILKNRNGQTGGKILFRYFYKYFYFQEAGNEYELLKQRKRETENFRIR